MTWPMTETVIGLEPRKRTLGIHIHNRIWIKTQSQKKSLLEHESVICLSRVTESGRKRLHTNTGQCKVYDLTHCKYHKPRWNSIRRALYRLGYGMRYQAGHIFPGSIVGFKKIIFLFRHCLTSHVHFVRFVGWILLNGLKERPWGTSKYRGWQKNTRWSRGAVIAS